MPETKTETDPIKDFFSEVDKVCSSKENLEAFLNETKPAESTKISEGTFLTIEPEEDGKPHYYHYEGKEIFKGACVPSKGDAIDIVVGDIHGKLDDLKELIQKSQFFDNKNVRLFFVGDYVDRGPDSLKSLIAVLKLRAMFPDRVFPVMGDHELGATDRVDKEDFNFLPFYQPQWQENNIIKDLIKLDYDRENLEGCSTYKDLFEKKTDDELEEIMMKGFEEIKEFHKKILERLFVCIKGDNYSKLEKHKKSSFVVVHSSLGGPPSEGQSLSSYDTCRQHGLELDIPHYDTNPELTDPLAYPKATCWYGGNCRGYPILVSPKTYEKQAERYGITNMFRGHDRLGFISDPQLPISDPVQIVLRPSTEKKPYNVKIGALAIHTLNTTSVFEEGPKKPNNPLLLVSFRIGKSVWRQIPLKLLDLKKLQAFSLLEKVKSWTMFASEVKSLQPSPVIITFKMPEKVPESEKKSEEDAKFFIPIGQTQKNWLEKIWMRPWISSSSRFDSSKIADKDKKTQEQEAGLLLLPKSNMIVVQPIKHQSDPKYQLEIEVLLRAAASIASAMQQEIEGEKKADISEVPEQYRPYLYECLKSLQITPLIIDKQTKQHLKYVPSKLASEIQS